MHASWVPTDASGQLTISDHHEVQAETCIGFYYAASTSAGTTGLDMYHTCPAARAHEDEVMHHHYCIIIIITA